MQKILKGNQIQLFYQGKTFAFATAHTLTITGNTADIASKDHGEWGASSVSNLSWEVTGDYFYTDLDYDTLFDLMLYKRPILVQAAEVRNYSENGLVDLGGDVVQWLPIAKGRQGYASITSLALNANTGEKATYSLTLTGSGPLTKYDSAETNQYLDVVYYSEDLKENNKYKIYNTINGNDAVMSIVAWATNTGGEGETYALDRDGFMPKDIFEEMKEEYDYFTVRYYLAGNEIPAHMFENLTLHTFNGKFTNNVTVGAYAFAHSTVSKRDAAISTSWGINYKDHCFDGCLELGYLNCPPGSTVSELNGINYGDYAFQDVALEQASHNTTQEEVEIGVGAFKGCPVLTTFNMPDNTVIVGQDAFDDCPGVELHFYQSRAPLCSNNSFGPVGQQHFRLHNVPSVASFLGDKEMSVYYPAATCDYEIVS